MLFQFVLYSSMVSVKHSYNTTFKQTYYFNFFLILQTEFPLLNYDRNWSPFCFPISVQEFIWKKQLKFFFWIKKFPLLWLFLQRKVIHSVCLSVCLFVYISIYLSTSIYLAIYLSIYLSIWFSIYLWTYLSIYVSIYLSVYLFIYLSTDPCIYLCMYRFI